MSFKLPIPSVVSTLLFAGLLLGCEVGGVGDPCVPEEEYGDTFSGFSADEVNVESRSFQCETRICLVNHFRGRVSCRYGNAESEKNSAVSPPPPDCTVPGSGGRTPVTVPVDPQLMERRAIDTVYCSCRCDGPDTDASYCECPSGFSCEHLVDKIPVGESAQLAGSYCIREGTKYSKNSGDNTSSCNSSEPAPEKRCDN